MVESLKPISRKFDLKDTTSEPKNDLTKHFKDFMSSSSFNLKRARSSSQPKESEHDHCRIRFDYNKTAQSSLYFDTMIKKDYVSEHVRKIFSNDNPVIDYQFEHQKTDAALLDTNNNKNKFSVEDTGSHINEKESVREKIIYRKSKTIPLAPNFRSESKCESYVDEDGTYSQPSLSEEQKTKKSLYITTQFTLSTDTCQPFKNNVTRNNIRVSSRLNRDSWHRIHKTFSCNKVVYPVSCETFL